MKKRAVLFSWMTGVTNWCLNEKLIEELYAATTIKNVWIGHATRAQLFYLVSQAGRFINTKCFIYKSAEDRKSNNCVITIQPKTTRHKIKKIDCNELISQLRGDYCPWKKEVDAYKAYKKEEEERKKQEEKKRKEEKPKEREISQSAMLVGIESKLEEESNKHVEENANQRKVVAFTPLKDTQVPSEIKNQKAKALSLKKQFNIDDEAANVFGKSLIDSSLVSLFAKEKRRSIVTPYAKSVLSRSAKSPIHTYHAFLSQQQQQLEAQHFGK